MHKGVISETKLKTRQNVSGIFRISPVKKDHNPHNYDRSLQLYANFACSRGTLMCVQYSTLTHGKKMWGSSACIFMKLHIHQLSRPDSEAGDWLKPGHINVNWAPTIRE